MLVLDASATLPLLFEDEATAETEQLGDYVAAAGTLVPAIWAVEVSNALMTAERRGRIAASKAAALLRSLSGLPIRTEQANQERVWTYVVPLARLHRLTVYDASYLELALRNGLPLATNDKALSRAAHDAGARRWPE